MVYLREELFWKLMFACPHVRMGVLGNMARRLQVYQSQELHREKLISLGTMAAGLMHELNNPGAAARRAASQMRENLSNMQQISLRLCSQDVMTAGQAECLRLLQEQALQPRKQSAMSSLDQADAEDELASWLEEHGIENAWKLAPTLAGIGFNEQTLECAQHEFPGNTLSDPLNWMAALISSVQLVGTIEESVSRVTDLVGAVKKYAYEDKPQRHQLDVHDSIQSTLVILGHKFRQKELVVEKLFAPGLPPLSTCGVGLSQVWTNLLDNAIDASPQKGVVTVRTWVNGDSVCVAIGDAGPGIPEENRKLIFEPFFTTKPTGQGTGLGLDIVRHIVVDKFGGEIRLDSVPGKTEFTIQASRGFLGPQPQTDRKDAGNLKGGVAFCLPGGAGCTSRRICVRRLRFCCWAGAPPWRPLSMGPVTALLTNNSSTSHLMSLIGATRMVSTTAAMTG